MSDDSLSDYPPPPPVETDSNHPGVQGNLGFDGELPPPPPEPEIRPEVEQLKEENSELRAGLEQLRKSIESHGEKLTCIESTNTTFGRKLDEQIELKEKLQESLIKTLDSKQELASEVREVVTNLEEKFEERFQSAKAQDADHTENNELLGEVSQKIEKIKESIQETDTSISGQRVEISHLKDRLNELEKRGTTEQNYKNTHLNPIDDLKSDSITQNQLPHSMPEDIDTPPPPPPPTTEEDTRAPNTAENTTQKPEIEIVSDESEQNAEKVENACEGEKEEDRVSSAQNGNNPDNSSSTDTNKNSVQQDVSSFFKKLLNS